uniref:Secreted protein n=1 Tax=Ixodes ricinus TaxID=34613 RepID=A0A6B0UMU9_IXORI
MTPIFNFFLWYMMDFFNWVSLSRGSLEVSRLVPRTVTFASSILLRKGARPSGPSSNSWLPRHTESYIILDIASATMLYFKTVYHTVPWKKSPPLKKNVFLFLFFISLTLVIILATPP